MIMLKVLCTFPLLETDHYYWGRWRRKQFIMLVNSGNASSNKL